MFDTIPAWVQALAIVLIVSWLIQLILHLAVFQRMWHRIRSQKKEQVVAAANAVFADPVAQLGVTILIYAHNQGELLLRNLPTLLEQDYSAFEVIVMDDNSRDDTADILSMMCNRFDHLHYSRIDEKVRGMSHRKLAVLLGTKGAHYDIVVMTQAQCLPASNQWLKQLTRHFADPATEVVIAPVAYERRSSFLSRFCQFDLFQRLVSLFGISLAIRPFAGWGQNMAFRKSIFYANRSQGFQRHLHIQPGEDDLFVADVARGNNVVMECQPESLVTDQSTPLAVSWSLDRLNRAFTSRLYSPLPAIVKVTDALTRYLTVLPAWVIIAYSLHNVLLAVDAPHATHWTLFSIALALLLVRAGVIILTYAATSKVLRLRPFVFWPLLCDLFTPLVDLWFRCKALLHKRSFGVGYIGLK